MTTRLSEYLEIDHGHTRCRKCGHDLGASEENWKLAAILREQPMDGAGGAPYQSGAHVRLRLFMCPGCARLLATETALEGDPFLVDKVSEN
jgi:acetone carboxylase gamma subunit